MTTFAAFYRELEAEARAKGPAAHARFRQLEHRYRIGGQISVRRKRKRLTQKQLAARAGLDQAEVSRIERGAANPTEDTLEAIARALGTELSLVTPRAHAAA